MISPFTEKMVSQSVYTIRYYEHKLQYSARQILNDDYTVYCGQLLKQELIIAGCAALLVAFVATFAVYWYIGRTGRQQSEDEIIGGRALSESPKDVARMMKKRGEASDIRIDDLPLKLDSEIQNMSMHGTVSTGKSTLMRKIMKQLRDRGDLVIIYDKGCTFIEDFYDESRDKVLNALDARCPNWDLWEECRTISELENASATLIPASSGEDPFWQGSARTIFAEGAERMRRDEDRSYNKFLRTLLAIQLDQLRTFLAGTPASTLVDGKIEKTAISIRSVLTNYVKAMRYLQGIDRPGREKFTIREWMKGQADKSKNGWLFITSDEQNHESLKSLISLWLSIAATSLLAMGPNRQRRVWFFRWLRSAQGQQSPPAMYSRETRAVIRQSSGVLKGSLSEDVFQDRGTIAGSVHVDAVNNGGEGDGIQAYTAIKEPCRPTEEHSPTANRPLMRVSQF